MNASSRFLLAITVLMLLMTGPFLLTALVVYFDMPPADRDSTLHLLLPHLPLGTVLTASGFLLGFAVLRRLFRQYVKGLQQMAEQLRVMKSANRNFRIAIEGPPEVQALATAANDLAELRDTVLTDVEQQVALTKRSVEDEKNRIAALLSQLAVGILVFNQEGIVLLYNRRALHQLRPPPGPGSIEATPVGLGRSIYSLLHRGVIDHARRSIDDNLAAGRSEPVAQFTSASRSGLMLRIHMAPILAQGVEQTQVINGYVLSVENITARQELKARRALTLHALAVDNGASLARVRDALRELLPPTNDGEGGRLKGIVAGELAAMQARIDRGGGELAGHEGSRPQQEMLVADLIAAACRRIGHSGISAKRDDVDEQLWVRVDGFSILHALGFIAAQLRENYAVTEIRLAGVLDDGMAGIDVIWSGLPMSSEIIHTWELEPMTLAGLPTSTTLRELLARHQGELRYRRNTASHRAILRLALPLAEPPGDVAEALPVAPASRPEFYDFDLFARRAGGPILDQPLASLGYTVFDTETTGLDPARDAIVQIGAVRIFNGRVLAQEVFDQLIDPQRPIPAASHAIHGIDDAMVRGRPPIEDVLPAFHAFCADTVLVGHNAAFDMRFLALQEGASDVRFDHPVLDTLLLSALLHPGQDSHSIEAVAKRLGVTIAARHAALGDALATAEIFAKMIPLLAEQGVHTLRQALAAAQKTWYARLRY